MDLNPWWLVFFLISLGVQAVAEPAPSSWKNKPKKKMSDTMERVQNVAAQKQQKQAADENMTAEMHNFRLKIITISQTNQ